MCSSDLVLGTSIAVLIAMQLLSRQWAQQDRIFIHLKNDLQLSLKEMRAEIAEKDAQRELALRTDFLTKLPNLTGFIELAEGELGEIIHHPWEFEPAEKEGYVQLVDQNTEEEKEHNSKVFARAREIEEQLWAELWRILEGQDYSKFEKAPDELDNNKSWDHWHNQFDGSGLRGWWD